LRNFPLISYLAGFNCTESKWLKWIQPSRKGDFRDWKERPKDTECCSQFRVISGKQPFDFDDN
jgi:hypothetical protein